MMNISQIADSRVQRINRKQISDGKDLTPVIFQTVETSR